MGVFLLVIFDSFNIVSKLKVRVDFETFEISPPDTRGQCVTDFFLVTGGSPVPTICGLNTGQHGKYLILRVSWEFNWVLNFEIIFGSFWLVK